LELGDGIQKIGENAFTYNGLVKTITVPDSVTSIGIDAFKKIHCLYYHGSLESEAEGYKYWGADFFNPYINGDFIYYDEGLTILEGYEGNGGDIVIPDGVKCFDDYISKEEVTPRNIYIPDTISVLRIQLDDWDTLFMGDGEIERLDLNCLSKGIKGTIVAPANSYIEQYCKEKGYRFRVMTDEEEKKWREKTEAAASEITYQE
jgi:hypothetical protein